MTSSEVGAGKKIHLVGIAGEGMAGLALCLLDLGYHVSGSDTKPLQDLIFLESCGVEVFSGQDAKNLRAVDIVVYSDAIANSNVELIEARICNIPVIRRAQAITELLKPNASIMVAGSHGKSTTTAMTATILSVMATDPSFLVGAEAASLQFLRGRIGQSSYFVGEACEAFQNLIHYKPSIAVITNIDDEHLEHYGSQSRLDTAFIDFANRANMGVVIHHDDEGIRRIRDSIQNNIITFGLNPKSDVYAMAIKCTPAGSCFDLYVNGAFIQKIFIPVPGTHVVLNALASIASVKLAGFNLFESAKGLSHYRGLKRRWQSYSCAHNIRIIDDFAHHPTELRAIRSTAREILHPRERLVIAFQPQLHSRTKRLARSFAQELSQFDEIHLLEVHGGDEFNSDPGGSSEVILSELSRIGSTVRYFSSASEFIMRAPRLLQPGDFLIIAGAGSISSAAHSIADCLNRLPFVPVLPPGTKVITAPPIQRNTFVNPTSDAYPGVLRFFYRQVADNPDAIAVSDSEQALSYAELNGAANCIAKLLVDQAIKVGDTIAVQAAPSLELIALIIAIQKLGGIYLPLDVNLPEKRAVYQCEIAKATLKIASVMQDNPIIEQGWNSQLSLKKIRDMVDLSLADNSLFSPEICESVNPQDGAYICFTSGSTGKPKGVLIGHKSLSNFIACSISQFDISCTSKVIVNTSIGFDVSVGEIWMTLAAGAQLCITGASKPLTGTLLGQFLRVNGITHLAVTPSVLASIPVEPLPHLRCIISAGEPPSPTLVALWSQDRAFINAYGPTEATIYASIFRCNPQGPIRIGTPLDQVIYQIVDSDLHPISGPGIGELCIGGIGLMQHYLPASSHTCFIKLMGTTGSAQRFYRTGDVVKRHPDGSLEYLHRLDSQIKLNGVRIELEEIEQIILQEAASVTDATVCVDTSKAHPRLIAFVVLKEGPEVNWPSLKQALSAWLAPPMVPSKFIPIKSMPLSLAGKKDRQLLISDYHRRKILSKNYTLPRTNIEQQLVAMWKNLLTTEFDPSVTEDFEWLGGDSIQFLELIDRIETMFGIKVPPGYLGNQITIEQLAIKIAELGWARNVDKNPVSVFTGSRVYKGLRDLTARWNGKRINESAITVSSGPATAKYDFFICLQNSVEFEEIAHALGDQFRVHAMRSGHLLMDYTPSAINELACHYVRELQAIAPRGKLLIGGICQGGAIATQMAQILTIAKYPLEALILIDQARLIPYPEKIAFIYSSKSKLNPYSRFTNDLSRFDVKYGKNYSIHLIDCEHGTIHHPPHVHSLANTIYEILCEPRIISDQPEHKQSFVNAFQKWYNEKRLLSDIELIEDSPFFDSNDYLGQLPKGSTESSEAIAHFVNHGWQRDLNPSRLFNTLSYLKRYPQVLAESINPLTHYLRLGMYQGKLPWSEYDLLNWQGPIHHQPELAVDTISRCKMPWIRLEPKQEILLFAHSQGHFVFRQLQEMLSLGLKSLGITNSMVDERFPFNPSHKSLAWIIGPHEFFFLPGAKDPQEFDLERLVLINSEQMTSLWFANLMPIFEKVRYILDLNLQTAACLVKLGMNARFLPMGYVPEHPLFQPILPNRDGFQYRLDVATPSAGITTPTYSLERKIDMLWIGSQSDRRAQFWHAHSQIFNSFSVVVKLVANQGPLSQTNSAAILPADFLRLAHRSKILLNVHHFDAPYFEWPRLMHFGFFQGCCVVTESCSHIPGLVPNTHYFEDELHQLPKLMAWLIHDVEGQKRLEQVRKAGYDAVMEHFVLKRDLAILFDLPVTQTKHS